jgi:hypothetical protein
VHLWEEDHLWPISSSALDSTRWSWWLLRLTPMGKGLLQIHGLTSSALFSFSGCNFGIGEGH